MYVIATVICPNFHFSVSPHVPFLNLLFEQIANSNEYLLAKFGFDTAENERSHFGSRGELVRWGLLEVLTPATASSTAAATGSSGRGLQLTTARQRTSKQRGRRG